MISLFCRGKINLTGKSASISRKYETHLTRKIREKLINSLDKKGLIFTGERRLNFCLIDLDNVFITFCHTVFN